MLLTIIKGYIAGLGTLARTAALFAVCLVIAALIVYPLWILATSHPGLYTVLVSCIFAGIFLTAVVWKIHAAWKIHGVSTLITLARFAVFAGGLVAFIILVINFQRTAGLIVLALAFLVKGYLAFVLKKRPGTSGT